MRRAVLILLVACDAGVHDVAPPPIAPPVVVTPVAKPVPPAPPTSLPPTTPSTVTSELPASAITTLTGCWRHDASETWTFRPDGEHGLVVVRELRDSFYADRARIPRSVNYDPKTQTFGFGAAGRIHGLMMLFQLEHGTLKNAVYTSHDGRSYVWTSNSWTLKRCS